MTLSMKCWTMTVTSSDIENSEKHCFGVLSTGFRSRRALVMARYLRRHDNFWCDNLYYDNIC